MTENPTAAVLSGGEMLAVVEPLYEAYRLGKYGQSEYLPMWHELDDKPTATPEAHSLIASVQSIVTAHVTAAEDRMREAVESVLVHPFALYPVGFVRVADVRAALAPTTHDAATDERMQG